VRETLIVIGYTALGLVILVFLLIVFLLWKVDNTSLPQGSLRISGKVYEWKDAPTGATSEIFSVRPGVRENSKEILEKMLVTIADGRTIVPLDYVEYATRHKESTLRQGDEYYWHLSRTDPTEHSGDINIFYTSPFKGTYLIRMEKPGYKGIIREVEHDGGHPHYVIVVIMVKDNG